MIGSKEPPLTFTDACDFLHQLECEVVVSLQRQCADLFFVHAACVEFRRAAHLFVAESGTGKSTTTWALLHHGFRYLSDELAPIGLTNLHVYAYPHALCLKQCPPEPYDLPAEAIYTTRTIHIPTRCMPRADMSRTCPLAALWFLTYDRSARDPSIAEITPAEASARLYTNALNQLAHSNSGLDAAVTVAKSIPSFVLVSADLAATCKLICSKLASCPKPPD